ncbi:unnamed protein product [Vicia faba]|uniref:RING-type E3 ubiquitin transferase n=1 Tax=Vicia faba TaxID=3906 RepID=A0AAV0YBD7_VICFA|nr:unnamed protein product [Vicia faba]
MTTFPYLIFLIILVSLCKTQSEDSTCGTSSCETFGLQIRFPFSTNQPNQTNLCSYPGFELTCSNTTTLSEPLLTLPNSETFVVKHISFIDQTVWVNDPNKCLPKRFMSDKHHGFMSNLKDSPFRLSDYYTFVNVSFLKCPSNSTVSSMLRPISCLNLDYPVVAMRSDETPFATPWVALCEFITSAMVPVEDTNWLFWNGYYSNIALQWDNPDCGSCEERGGTCGLVEEDRLRLACYELRTREATRRFIGDEETSFSRRRYAPQILTINESSTYYNADESEALKFDITFSKKNATSIHPHNNNPMVITIKFDDCEITRVLIDQGRSTNILYWDDLERLCLNLYDLKAFQGSLVGFYGK